MSLNPQQIEGVINTDGATLILAGAGSGKTRVLTHRVAHMVESGKAFPGEILALTFTNKAAKEMQLRVSSLLSEKSIPSYDLLITTFHSFGVRILREFATEVGLDDRFIIFDSSDQASLVKECMRELDIDPKRVPPKLIVSQISQLKNNESFFEVLKGNSTGFNQEYFELIKLYHQKITNHNAVDFGDLLFKTYLLLKENEEICKTLQNRWKYVLVDEYQDTNRIQFLILEKLCQSNRNLCVVGDEDQSIYKWRGADIKNILDFEEVFPEAKVIRLEQNYRSTSNIIHCASKVIANNKDRYEKKLFTENISGDPVAVFHFDTDSDEASGVVRKIKSLTMKDYDFNDVAILYRTHAQSRIIEDALRSYNVPYSIFGSLKFYERSEIKDSLCYLRLVLNSTDDLAFLRVINQPTRGIGKKTIETIRQFAISNKLPLLEASFQLASTGTLRAKAKSSILKFYEIIDYAKKMMNQSNSSVVDQFQYIMEKSGYTEYLITENTFESKARVDNLREFENALTEFHKNTKDPSLKNFLEKVALINDHEDKQENSSSIKLMTLHACKGLEFPVVFMVGMEDDLFPSNREDDQMSSTERLEEERRLCYVGMTRAQKKLFLSFCCLRRIYGRSQRAIPSPFLLELPLDCIDILDKRAVYKEFPSLMHFNSGHGVPMQAGNNLHQESSFNDDFYQDSGDEFGGAYDDSSIDNDDSGFKAGQRVTHPEYGAGIILSLSGIGDSSKVLVKFNHGKPRKFAIKFAPLRAL